MACRYAGIDWATEKHDVLVADEMGAEVLAATYAHDEKGLTALCRTLMRLEVELVAIERPDGLLVDRLLDAGLRVLALHPNKVAAVDEWFKANEPRHAALLHTTAAPTIILSPKSLGFSTCVGAANPTVSEIHPPRKPTRG